LYKHSCFHLFRLQDLLTLYATHGGISLAGSEGGFVANNNVKTESNGIQIVGSHCVVLNNKITGNIFYGIFLGTGSYNAVSWKHWNLSASRHAIKLGKPKPDIRSSNGNL
jgi:parallel beta-helix repeat protein